MTDIILHHYDLSPFPRRFGWHKSWRGPELARKGVSVMSLAPVDIRGEDIIETVRAALQFVSYYHPKDYIQHLATAYECEESPAAKDAMAQILINSRMAALGRRPICQDTGLVVVFAKLGQDARILSDRPRSPG